MKKLLLFAFLPICIFANAQEKLGIGIKIGQNLTSVNSVAVDRHAASSMVGQSESDPMMIATSLINFSAHVIQRMLNFLG